MGRSENNENEYHIGEGVIEEEDGRGDSVGTWQKTVGGALRYRSEVRGGK